jgi:uncharacterized protein (DUF2147 family)
MPIRRGTCFILACLLASPVAADDGDVTGRWRSAASGGVIELYRCGPALCGKVVDGAALRANPDQRDVRNPDPALRDRRVKGLEIIHGFTGGPREWSGDAIYDPATGEGAPKGYLTVQDADTLRVKGCVAGFLCRSQVWTRVR